MNYKLINIKTIPTENQGGLSFFEASRDVPFNIKRIYYVYGANAGTERGSHAHKTLEQFLFCPCGSIELILDSGRDKASIVLDNPSEGLFLSKDIWRIIIWRQKNSVLCVAASDYYNEDDYIRDYDEFIEYISSKGSK